MSEDICSICLSEYDASANYCILTCKHTFHFTCIANHIKYGIQRSKCPICINQLIPTQNTRVEFDKLHTYVPEKLRDILQEHIDRGKSLFYNTTIFLYKFGEEDDDFAPVIRNEDGNKDIAYLPDGSIMGHFSSISQEELEMIK